MLFSSWSYRLTDVPLYIYIYIYTCDTQTHIFIYIIHVWVCACACVCEDIYIYIYIYIIFCVYLYLYTYICTYTPIYRFVHLLLLAVNIPMHLKVHISRHSSTSRLFTPKESCTFKFNKTTADMPAKYQPLSLETKCEEISGVFSAKVGSQKEQPSCKWSYWSKSCGKINGWTNNNRFILIFPLSTLLIKLAFFFWCSFFNLSHNVILCYL